ncbi:cytochrome b-c1 complex subunit 1, mitochondrial [[Candida] jaroonii]|uniref:Cytochrome b-c1 complex subunit 1, mitochondrial n=1 Tax=[Candida] jaroonii TaxID=467808 RepID=A0ACA9YBF6_9ASCO|nr:cytochrome b-c1 complex subunit 1, mitochondrial [[Candida] jaroonii]
MIRGIKNIKALSNKRFISTANTTTKYASLSNGVTIATESNPHAKVSSIGLFYGAGSRSEHAYSNGISALTTNILGSGLENGVLLTSENGKETNGIIAQTTNDNIIEASKIIAKIGSNASEIIKGSEFELFKKQLIGQGEQLESVPQKMILEHLSASAFQGYSLGLPTLGTSSSVKDLQVDDAERLLEKHLVGSNVVISASGNINHDELVETIESSLNIPQGHKPITKPASFLGSEVRMRDDTLPKAFVSIGVEGEGFTSPAYYVAKVAANVFGSFDSKATNATLTSSKLSSMVHEYHLVDKFQHFSTSYSDNGLWGFSCEVSNVQLLDDFIHWTLKEWNRLSVSITDAEIERAKQQTKVQLLAELNSTKSVVSDIGNKVLLSGYRNSITEALSKIDSIQTKDVKAWAKVALWDKDIVISSTGQTEALMDYSKWRNQMAMLRW